MKLKRSIIIIIANLIAMFLIVIGVTVFFLPSWLNSATGHSISRRVPVVIGLDAAKAIEMINAAELRPMVIDTVYSDGRMPGEVIEQLPEGNLPVKPNRIVYLTINAYDVRKVLFPDVIQFSSRQAMAQLKELNFVVDSIKYEPFEFDDLVLSVTSSENDKEMIPSTLYPVRTHVIVHVGSTSVEIEAVNDSTEQSFFE